MVKDLHSFGNCITDIMLGRANENYQMGLKKTGKKQIASSLDIIPLNWSKVQEMPVILSVLQMLYGPYSMQNKMDVNSAAVLEEVHTLATRMYKTCYNSFDGLDGAYSYQVQSINELRSECHAKRLKSYVLNNKAVQSLLNIMVDTSQGEAKMHSTNALMALT